MGSSHQHPLLEKLPYLPVSCPAITISTPIPVQMIKLSDPTPLLGLPETCVTSNEKMIWVNLIFSCDLEIGRQIILVKFQDHRLKGLIKNCQEIYNRSYRVALKLIFMSCDTLGFPPYHT